MELVKEGQLDVAILRVKATVKNGKILDVTENVRDLADQLGVILEVIV
jgi:hypothetical protein